MHSRNVRRETRGGPLRLLLMLLVVLSLLAAACGESEDADDGAAGSGDGQEDGDGDMGDDGDEDGDAADEDDGDMADPADAEPIDFGWIAWDENIANTFLWKEILEQEGYEVTETQLDAAPVYAGIADGSLDLFLDAWLPITHQDYWDQYGDQIEDLGVWHAPGVLTIAVPDYVEVTSLADLADYADTFGSQIVGIEPGAGLTRITREEVMPGYGLDDWTLLESSTPAMLTELERAISNEEPIVVTLWRPHWAYAEYPIRDLEDPQTLLGEPEDLHALARGGFSEDYPQVAEWISNFEMTPQELGTLSAMMTEAEDGQEQEAARQWIEENRALVDSWLGR